MMLSSNRSSPSSSSSCPSSPCPILPLCLSSSSSSASSFAMSPSKSEKGAGGLEGGSDEGGGEERPVAPAPKGFIGDERPRPGDLARLLRLFARFGCGGEDWRGIFCENGHNFRHGRNSPYWLYDESDIQSSGDSSTISFAVGDSELHRHR
jgi:hypothetical protein